MHPHACTARPIRLSLSTMKLLIDAGDERASAMVRQRADQYRAGYVTVYVARRIDGDTDLDLLPAKAVL